jgi:hypothetical protein
MPSTKDERMRWQDHEPRRADVIAQRLPNLTWEHLSAVLVAKAICPLCLAGNHPQQM